MADQSPTLSRALLSEIIATNEIGSAANAYVLSHAGTGNSGYSVGAFQLDLAHQSGARQTVEDFLSGTQAFDDNALGDIAHGLTTTGNPNAIAPSLISAINVQFATDGGKAMIDDLDAGQTNALMDDIAQALGRARTNLRYVTDAAFQAFSDSDLFQALMGDNANQYGPPNTFGRYIEGQAVTVGGNRLELGGNPWNLQSFAAYEAHYSYVTGSEQGAAEYAQATHQRDQCLGRKRCAGRSRSRDRPGDYPVDVPSDGIGEQAVTVPPRRCGRSSRFSQVGIPGLREPG